MYFILSGANSEEVADACLLAVCYCDSRVSTTLSSSYLFGFKSLNLISEVNIIKHRIF